MENESLITGWSPFKVFLYFIIYKIFIIFYRHSSQRDRTNFSFLDSRPNTNQSYRVSFYSRFIFNCKKLIPNKSFSHFEHTHGYFFYFSLYLSSHRFKVSVPWTFYLIPYKKKEK